MQVTEAEEVLDFNMKALLVGRSQMAARASLDRWQLHVERRPADSEQQRASGLLDSGQLCTMTSSCAKAENMAGTRLLASLRPRPASAGPSLTGQVFSVYKSTYKAKKTFRESAAAPKLLKGRNTILKGRYKLFDSSSQFQALAEFLI